jgi:hypothetical protein
MTQEQFIKATNLQKEIKLLKEKNDKLQDIINRLKEYNSYPDNHQVQNILIKLNDAWVATPIGTVDYGDLVNFIIQQRLKNETKIEKMQEEFEKV